MSATSFSASPHRRVLASSTSLKRKAGSNNQAIPLGPESSDRQWQIGSADTNTPFRPGSARRVKEGLRNSHSSSRSASAPNPANDPPAGPPKSTQLNMDHYLEDEMRGAIFSDPKFVSNFLSVEKEHQPLLEEVLKNIPGNTPGVLDDTITLERGLYGPILSVFRSIKQAVDTVRVAHNLGVLGTNFQDSHTNSIPGVDPDTELIKPDLVLFEDDDPAQRHWETVMMPVGVKAKRTYRKVAMKQLTRYARATFAHQIHRRHLYGIIVCKWAVTFVRFDRSGIVHSEPIDMLSNYQEFQRAFAALMMLDRRAFGYDTAFTTERTLGRPEYYVDLPAEAFLSDRGGIGEEPTTNPVDSSADTAANSARQFSAPRLPARKFKVMERLCHRKSIRGRATIVLRLREVRECAEQLVSDPSYAGPMTRQRTQSQRTEPKWVEVPAGRDYVLKLIWRDPSKPQEGQILDCLKDEYGIVQCQWFSDILRWGANCHKLGATSCNKCCDITPAQVAVQRAKNLGDLDVQVAREEDGKETEYLEVETDGCVGELYAQRMARIYGWALLTTVGRLLWTADSQRQFLEAVQDATLGYWQAVNSGVLHRDISDGNVLIAEPGESYELCKWKLKQGSTEQEDGEQTTGNSHQLAESRKLAREAILQLGRDLRGFLSDFDLATTHSGLGSELYDQASTKKRASDFAKPTVVDGADLGPSAKRLRLEDHSPSDSLSSSPGNVEEEGSSEEFDPLPVPASGHQQHKLIDFRTGTSTFMSIRVLRVQPGTHYEHHFMDDLESFFWLIFWCVVQRIDSGSDGNGGKEPTHEVLTLLHKLDRADSEMTTVADTKVTLLRDCTADEDETPKMETLLKGCQNSWACDPAIIHVVLKLGVYFENISDRGVRYLKCTPAKDFPKFFGIISEGLKMMSSPSHHTGP